MNEHKFSCGDKQKREYYKIITINNSTQNTLKQKIKKNKKADKSQSPLTPLNEGTCYLASLVIEHQLDIHDGRQFNWLLLKGSL